MTSLTTLNVEFVSESAGYKNTFGWYNKRTGEGGILFSSIEAEGRRPTVTPGTSVQFTVATSELADIQYFLIPDGGAQRQNTADELAGPIKVIQLANGAWAVATVDDNGQVETDGRGRPNILAGEGANALFSEKAKNAGGVDYASSKVGSNQTAATLAGDTADGPTGLLAWEDLAATRKSNGNYSKPGDADYNDAVFNITIANPGGNRAPVANNDAATVIEDSTVLIDVLANDSDADGNPLSIVAGSVTATNGTAVIEGGKIRFTPTPDYNGPAQISYRVMDGTAESNAATVNINITPVNDAPVIAPISAGITDEDAAPITINLVQGATDIDGNAVNVSGVASVVSSNAGRTVSFTPVGNTLTLNPAQFNDLGVGQSETITISYMVTDGTETVANTATVIIQGRNDGPVAQSASLTVVEDAAVVSGSVAATDAEANAVLSYALNGAAPAGLAFNSDGSYSFDPSVAAYQTLGVGQSVVLTVPYKVTDDQDAASTANLVITVTGTNDPAIIGDLEDAIVGKDESAPDLVATGTISIADVDMGEALFQTTVISALDNIGMLSLAADGAYTYTVANDAVQYLVAGETKLETFTVTALDGTAKEVTFTIAGFSAATEITGDLTGSVEEDVAPTASGMLVLSGSGNAPQFFSVVNGPATYGRYSLTANGEWTYTLHNTSPTVQSLGASEEVHDYLQVRDFNNVVNGSIDVTVVGTNDAPIIAQSPINFGLYSGGEIAFSEIDLADGLHLISTEFVSSTSGTQLGAMGASIQNEPSPFFGQDGLFNWHYSLPEDAFNALLGSGVTDAAETWRIMLSDLNGGIAIRDITIQILGNVVPSSFDQTLAAAAGRPADGQVQGYDPDFFPLTFSVATGPAHGTLFLDDASGFFTYLADADYSGADSFTYVVNDGQADSRVATVTFDVDQPPVVADFSFTTGEDAGFAGALIGSDPDGDPIQFFIHAYPQYGSVSLDPFTGAFTYDPLPNYFGPDSFTYSAYDGFSFTVPATVSIDVLPDAGDAPIVSSNNILTIDEDTSSGPIVIDAYDPDGEPLTYTIFSQPQFGTVEIIDNTLVYTPLPDVFGIDNFTLAINDGTSSVEQHWAVNVLPVDDPNSLQANPDSYALDADQVLVGNVLDNDTNIDSDTIGAFLVEGPAFGTVIFGDGGAFQYIPDPTFGGDVTFTYQAVAVGEVSEITPVTITVTVPDNFAPTVQNVHVDGQKGVVTPLVLTGSDPDGTVEFFEIADVSAAGSFYLDEALTQPVPSDGRIPASGNSATLYLASPAGSVGDFGFDYIAIDNEGKPSYATAHASVTIPNLAPAADGVGFPIILGDIATAYEPQSVIPIELASFHPFEGVSHIVISPDALPGTLYLDAGLTQPLQDGDEIPVTGATTTVYFVPNVSSGPAILPYDLILNSGASLGYAAAVGPESGVPVALSGTDPDGIVADFLLGSLGIVGLMAPIFYFDAALTQPILANAIPASANAATIYVSSAEHVTVTAALAHSGFNTLFRYVARDDNGAVGDSAEIALTLAERPETIDVAGALLLPNATLAVPLSGTDDGAVSAFEISAVGVGVSLFADAALSQPIDAGAIVTPVFDDDTGQYLQPTLYARSDAGFAGPTSFQFAAIDDMGLHDLSPATASIDVAGTGHAPTAADLSVAGNEDQQITFSLTGTDTDYASFVSTFRIVDLPEHGSLRIAGPFGQTFLVETGRVYAAPGQLPLRFSPDPEFSGATSFQYEVIDVTGEASLVPATVTITIAPVNDAPVATDQLFRTPVGATLNGELTATDVDGDSITFALTPDITLTHGILTLNPDGSFSYAPDAGFKGYDFFSFAVSDGQENLTPVTAIIAVDSAPVADPLALSGNEDTPISGQLTASDFDGDSFQFVLYGAPEHGTITSFNADGSFTYEPFPDYFGADTFTFAAYDGLLDGNVATVSFAVAPVAEAPVASADSYITVQNASLAISAPGILINDFDPDGDVITATLVDAASHGAVELHLDGSLIYQPAADYFGWDTFSYRISDGTLLSAAATVDIFVRENHAPQAFEGIYVLAPDISNFLGLSGIDGDGDILTFAIVDAPLHGSIAEFDSSFGTLFYTSESGFHGADSFTFKVNDGFADSAVVTVSLIVDPPPIASFIVL